MNKQLALQRTRMYAALRESHPLYFGDPLEFHSSQLSGFSGPAYEQRNGGGAGLIGAVLAVATGGMSLGFTTLASTLSTISLVGSVVGAVTGNKAFSTIGAIAGFGGAFMNLSAAGTFGDGLKDWSGTMEKTFSSTAQNISSSAAATANPTMTPGTATVEAGSPSASVVDQATDLNLAQNAPVESQAVNTPGEGGNGLIDTSGAVDPLSKVTVDGNPGSSMLNPDGTPNGVPSQVPGTSNATPATSNPALNVANAGEPVNAMAAKAAQGGNLAQIKAASSGIDTGTSLFDRISEFANKNKALTEMALKGVQGMYQSPQDKAYKEAQTTSANAMAGLYDAKTAEINGQIANGNAVPNVGGMSVNPNAKIYRQTPVIAAGVHPAGLIQTRA